MLKPACSTLDTFIKNIGILLLRVNNKGADQTKDLHAGLFFLLFTYNKISVSHEKAYYFHTG